MSITSSIRFMPLKNGHLLLPRRGTNSFSVRLSQTSGHVAFSIASPIPKRWSIGRRAISGGRGISSRRFKAKSPHYATRVWISISCAYPREKRWWLGEGKERGELYGRGEPEGDEGAPTVAGHIEKEKRDEAYESGICNVA